MVTETTEDKQRRDARERKRKSRAAQKAQIIQATQTDFAMARVRDKILHPGDIDPARACVPAATVSEALPIVRLWLRALALPDIQPGESLQAAERRIYDALRAEEKDHGDFPLLNLKTERLDSIWTCSYKVTETFEEEWPRIPGDDEPLTLVESAA